MSPVVPNLHHRVSGVTGLKEGANAQQLNFSHLRVEALTIACVDHHH